MKSLIEDFVTIGLIVFYVGLTEPRSLAAPAILLAAVGAVGFSLGAWIF